MPYSSTPKLSLTAFLALGTAFSAHAQGTLPAFRIRPPSPAAISIPGSTGAAIMAHMADMDGDRDLDIVMSGFWDAGVVRTRIYFNDGRGGFPFGSDASTGTRSGPRFHVADLDNNGTLDVLSPQYLWLNTHKFINSVHVGRHLMFQQVQPSRWKTSGSIHDIVAGDLNGDGRVDIFTAEQNGPHRIYIQDIFGQWIDESTSRLPRFGASRRVLLVDVTGDKSLDILHFDTPRASQVRVWKNSGKGKFTDVTSTLIPRADLLTREIRVADVDGDKDLDLILANKGKAVLWTNEGGKFVDRSSWLPRVDL